MPARPSLLRIPAIRRLLLRLPIDPVEQGGLAVAGAASLALRAILLVGKFAFIVALAGYTDTATVGLYALLVTIVTIAIYIIGLEIHTFTTREIVSDHADGRGAEHVQSHLLTVIGVFLLVLPFVYGFAVWLQIASKFSFFLLAAVMLCECIGQELGRYLLILSRPVASNLLQFIRGAAWMPVPLILLLTGLAGHVIDTILRSWLAGVGAACLFGAWNMRHYLTRRHAYRLAWLSEAFGSARAYMVVALLTQVQYYSDRFVIQRALGEGMVGVYSFYQNFANTMMAFVQTGVVAVLLPRLILAAKQDDVVAERRIRGTMLAAALGLSLVISLALALGMPLLLRHIHKDAYDAARPVFYVLLAGNLLLIAGVVVHLSLYARRRDADLMRVALIVIPLGLVANIVVVQVHGIMGAALTLTVVAALDLALKCRLLRKGRPVCAVSS